MNGKPYLINLAKVQAVTLSSAARCTNVNRAGHWLKRMVWQPTGVPQAAPAEHWQSDVLARDGTCRTARGLCPSLRIPRRNVHALHQQPQAEGGLPNKGRNENGGYELIGE